MNSDSEKNRLAAATPLVAEVRENLRLASLSAVVSAAERSSCPAANELAKRVNLFLDYVDFPYHVDAEWSERLAVGFAYFRR